MQVADLPFQLLQRARPVPYSLEYSWVDVDECAKKLKNPLWFDIIIGLIVASVIIGTVLTLIYLAYKRKQRQKNIKEELIT